MRVLKALLIAGLAFVTLVFAGLWLLGRQVDHIVNPAPETLVSASVRGLRAQNRLSAFVARYVAVVTSTQHRFGLSTAKTLIMPGTVRYEVDLAKLANRDVCWDGATKTLSVTLPPLQIEGPEIDLTQIREYGDHGLLAMVTDAATTLDAANRRAGQAELIRQARQPVPMTLARDATRRAIEQSFALPLRAAGIAATVRVRFPGEPDFPKEGAEPMDRSRPLQDVLNSGR